jgi:hypothetical protein
MNDHAVLAKVHQIHQQLDLIHPPYSTVMITERLFPEIDVIGRSMARHATLEIFAQPLPSGHRALVSYNERDHHSTQRFSIAHELAHYIFDQGAAVVCWTQGPKPTAERRADYFASELLVPLWRLDEHVTFNLAPDIDDEDAVSRRTQNIQRLASRWNVSMACMRRRVIDLVSWRKVSRGR